MRLRVALSASVLVACGHDGGGPARSAKSNPFLVASSSVAPLDVTATPPVDASVLFDAALEAGEVDAGPAYPGRTDGCADGMVRVDGDYCPHITQVCIWPFMKHPEEHDWHQPDRCIKFSPSTCRSPRKKLSFCMDRFEYPNKTGELPLILVSWGQAADLCKAQNKRLCTYDEFNFACEGPEMLPYVYGLARDATKCNIDRDYIKPDHSRVLLPHEQCEKTPWCAAEIARLDQRKKIGENTQCVSWAGVYDLNGNVNEWVNIPASPPPNRSGLKGGWWGQVRSRCRPLVSSHDEKYYGYEVGFRCCADASNEGAGSAPKPSSAP